VDTSSGGRPVAGIDPHHRRPVTARKNTHGRGTVHRRVRIFWRPWPGPGNMCCRSARPAQRRWDVPAAARSYERSLGDPRGDGTGRAPPGAGRGARGHFRPGIEHHRTAWRPPQQPGRTTAPALAGAVVYWAAAQRSRAIGNRLHDTSARGAVQYGQAGALSPAQSSQRAPRQRGAGTQHTLPAPPTRRREKRFSDRNGPHGPLAPGENTSRRGRGPAIHVRNILATGPRPRLVRGSGAGLPTPTQPSRRPPWATAGSGKVPPRGDRFRLRVAPDPAWRSLFGLPHNNPSRARRPAGRRLSPSQ
jgi:hypothetical protein